MMGIKLTPADRAILIGIHIGKHPILHLFALCGLMCCNFIAGDRTIFIRIQCCELRLHLSGHIGARHGGHDGLGHGVIGMVGHLGVERCGEQHCGPREKNGFGHARLLQMIGQFWSPVRALFYRPFMSPR